MVLQWSFRAHLRVVRYSTLAVRNLVPVYFAGLFVLFCFFRELLRHYYLVSFNRQALI